jgi:hypothetical protein
VVWAGKLPLSHSGWSGLEGWLAGICHGQRASNRIRFRRRLRQHSRCQPIEIHEYRETYFRVNHRRVIRHFEAFGCLIPIGPNPLRSQLYPFAVFFHNFTQTEVRYFHFAIMKEYILRLEVIVNNFLLLIVQVLQTAQYLRDNQLGFLFWYLLMLLKIKVEIGA